jgi:chromosome segregation ATPase
MILQKEELEEQLRSLADKYKQKRREMKQLQEDLKNMEEALTSLIQDENSCEELIQEKSNKILQLDKDLRELGEKLERANKQLFTLIRDLRRSRNTEDPTIEEKDYKVKDLITFNIKKAKDLISITEQYPLLRQTLQILFAQVSWTLNSFTKSITSINKCPGLIRQI